MNESVKEFTQLLTGLLKETGTDLKRQGFEVAAYSQQQMRKLSSAVGQRGWDEALIASRDAIALFAGIEALDAAKAADARVIGAIEGALAIGARALATGGM